MSGPSLAEVCEHQVVHVHVYYKVPRTLERWAIQQSRQLLDTASQWTLGGHLTRRRENSADKLTFMESYFVNDFSFNALKILLESESEKWKTNQGIERHFEEFVVCA